MHKLVALACGLLLLADAPLAAQSADPWLARTTKVQFNRQRAADAPFQLDVPRNDWSVGPRSGSALMMLTSRRGDAVVLVERSALQLPLEPADVTEVLADIEIEIIKERYPRAAEFQKRLLEDGRRRLVAVQYTRQGERGSERVRQYSLPRGNQLYRVICISNAAQFTGYEPIFSHIAASFSVIE